jgi:hypothetical protein
VTLSNLRIKLWYKRLLQVHQLYGRARGPAICYKDGFQLTSRAFNLKLCEALMKVWEETPSLFLSNVKGVNGIEVHFNVYRSFRRGSNSRAVKQCLDKLVTDTVNRWKVLERTGSSRPGNCSMSQHYAEANLLKKVRMRYTFAM